MAQREINQDAGQSLYDTCPVCASAYDLWRTKKVGEASYRIDRCRSCGFAFVNPRPSLAFLTDYYAAVGHQIQMLANHSTPTLESVIAREREEPNSTLDARRLIATIKSRHLGSNGNRFFDVGCGYGFFSHEALRQGFDVVALELAGNERRIAAEMTGLEPVALPFEQYEGDPCSISVMLMSQILEHAQDINAWLSKARCLLRTNGILAIALPNFDSIFRRVLQENEPYITPPEHLNYFNAGSLSILLEKHGFAVEKIEWVSRMPRRALERRLPPFAKPTLPFVHMLARAPLAMFDWSGLGVMLNLYASKRAV